MASHADEHCQHKDTLIFIMPQRIQSKMLQDIKSAVNRLKFCTREKFSEDVTHIVTQYDTREQVFRQLQRDGIIISDKEAITSEIVSLSWLSACFKSGHILQVEDSYRLTKTEDTDKNDYTVELSKIRTKSQSVPFWACQRVTPLQHFNEKFTNALEILEKHAEFRSLDNDYSRALAFRRSASVLKSLPFQVERISQVQGLKDMGGHVLKVIQNILEDGYSEEVKMIQDNWFCLMKLFTSVYGVGPATAKKWIEKGWKSVSDVRNSESVSKDERIIWALAFHEDLTDPVTRSECEAFVHLIEQEAKAILPGVQVQLVGGFRRGKTSGHDVDILLTHPEEGQERGLLLSLLQRLERQDRVLMGHHEQSTYSPDTLIIDSKLASMRGQLDHFEKWLGICKFEHSESGDNSFKDEKVQRDVEKDGDLDKSKDFDSVLPLVVQNDLNFTDSNDCKISCQRLREIESSSSEQLLVTHENLCKSDIQQHCKQEEPGLSQVDNLDSSISLNPKIRYHKNNYPETHEPAASDSSPGLSPKKRPKNDHTLTPSELAASYRSWKARRVDLIVVPHSQYFYALVGWTGSKHFNRDLRLYAQKQCNMKLTSHGLYDIAKILEGLFQPTIQEDEGICINNNMPTCCPYIFVRNKENIFASNQ